MGLVGARDLGPSSFAMVGAEQVANNQFEPTKLVTSRSYGGARPGWQFGCAAAGVIAGMENERAGGNGP